MTKSDPLIDLNILLRSEEVTKQQVSANAALRNVIKRDFQYGDSISGLLYDISTKWHDRFNQALKSEIPDDRFGLTGFRFIPDHIVFAEDIEKVFSIRKIDDFELVDGQLSTLDDVWKVINRFNKKDNSSKSIPKQVIKRNSDLEQHLIDKKGECNSVLGGQAGNVAWFWHVLGTDPIAYIPYISKEISDVALKLKNLNQLRVCCFIEDKYIIGTIDSVPKGVRFGDVAINEHCCSAPTGGSVIIADGSRRLIFQFDGFRDLATHDEEMMPFKGVKISNGSQFTEKLKFNPEISKLNWPQISYFSKNWIDIDEQTLQISLIDEKTLRDAFQDKVNCAVVGGIDTIFTDDLIKFNDGLTAKLAEGIKTQLKILKNMGIKIGVELSKKPDEKYLNFLRELCKEEIIIAIGLNGEDELPLIIKDSNLNREERIFNQQSLDNLVREHNDELASEYITYLYANGLINWLSVRHLYVHTNTVDLILQQGNNTNTLDIAQLGCMKGKGWVIGALSVRCWPIDTYEKAGNFTPAINPAAFAKFGQFIIDFGKTHKFSEEETISMLETGYWVDTIAKEYSVAAVPVLWPRNSELPSDLNTTGAGDMSFAAFMFFGIN